MAKGGFRPGAGRPYGAVNKKTRAVIEAALEAGELPICYMLRIMRDEKIRPSRRDDMAKAAANFVHSRVWAVNVPEDGEPLFDAQAPDAPNSLAAPAIGLSRTALPNADAEGPTEAHAHSVAAADGAPIAAATE